MHAQKVSCFDCETERQKYFVIEIVKSVFICNVSIGNLTFQTLLVACFNVFDYPIICNDNSTLTNTLWCSKLSVTELTFFDARD